VDRGIRTGLRHFRGGTTTGVPPETHSAEPRFHQGIAAAIGLVLYFVGAVGAHLRGRDFTGMPSAAVLLAASTAALILGAISS
jgi:hypothetical protein